MFVPSCLHYLDKIVPKIPSRYAMDGILFERDSDTGRCTAVATDARRLVAVTWDDAETMVEQGVTPVTGFSRVLPPDLIKAAAKNCSSRSHIPLHRMIEIEEGPGTNGDVTVKTRSYDGEQTATRPVVEGTFPPYEQAFPFYSPGHDSIRFRFDGKLLASTLTVIGKALQSDDNKDRIEMTVPIRNGPVLLEGFHAGKVVRSVFMPLVQATDEEPLTPLGPMSLASDLYQALEKLVRVAKAHRLHRGEADVRCAVDEADELLEKFRDDDEDAETVSGDQGVDQVEDEVTTEPQRRPPDAGDDLGNADSEPPLVEEIGTATDDAGELLGPIADDGESHAVSDNFEYHAEHLARDPNGLAPMSGARCRDCGKNVFIRSRLAPTEVWVVTRDGAGHCPECVRNGLLSS